MDLEIDQLSLFVYSYAVVGIVVAGGSWYLTRLARGPTSAYRFLCENEPPAELSCSCLDQGEPNALE